jgi:hypothetical protein
MGWGKRRTGEAMILATILNGGKPMIDLVRGKGNRRGGTSHVCELCGEKDTIKNPCMCHCAIRRYLDAGLTMEEAQIEIQQLSAKKRYGLELSQLQ